MEQRKKRTKYLVMAVVLLLCSIVATVAFAKYGLSTEEIKTIQRKLKNWGYYSGEVDCKMCIRDRYQLACDKMRCMDVFRRYVRNCWYSSLRKTW